MVSTIPVLGVRYISALTLTRGEPALRLGRGHGLLVPGEGAIARCLPSMAQRIHGIVRPWLPRRIRGNVLLPGSVLREEHESPAEDCECGIYAWNHLRSEHLNTYIGIYLGWGRVYHGRNYWRAQYVKPVAIGKLGRPERFDLKGERARWIERLSEKYDIPLLNEYDIDYYVTQFGRWPQREDALA